MYKLNITLDYKKCVINLICCSTDFFKRDEKSKLVSELKSDAEESQTVISKLKFQVSVMLSYTPFTWTKIIQIRDLDSYLDREILSRVNTTSGSRIQIINPDII